jgi:hypothetical protein
MTIVFARIGAIVFGAIATVALLVAVVALVRGFPDRVGLYLVIAVAASFAVARLMRAERRYIRSLEPVSAAAPPRRVPRSPIRFPMGESALAFAFWYVVALAVDRVVSGGTTFFTLAAIAPFAAFMLTTLTVAGRHMAFRLTAEEAGDEAGPSNGPR